MASWHFPDVVDNCNTIPILASWHTETAGYHLQMCYFNPPTLISLLQVLCSILQESVCKVTCNTLALAGFNICNEYSQTFSYYFWIHLKWWHLLTVTFSSEAQRDLWLSSLVYRVNFQITFASIEDDGVDVTVTVSFESQTDTPNVRHNKASMARRGKR